MMKTIILLSLLLLPVAVAAQETQISFNAVLREQTRLGYEPHNWGAKIEGIWKFNDSFLFVGYVSALDSPKRDSGTGSSAFGSAGIRWTPLRFDQADVFTEVDGIVGALNTVLYRKTVAHIRAGAGVRVLDKRLQLQVSRLFTDLLPDALKLLEERGFDPVALRTALNRLHGWDYEAQYWSKPWRENSKWGMRFAFRVSHSNFVKNFQQERATAWWAQYEVGPYRRF